LALLEESLVQHETPKMKKILVGKATSNPKNRTLKISIPAKMADWAGIEVGDYVSVEAIYKGNKKKILIEKD